MEILEIAEIGQHNDVFSLHNAFYGEARTWKDWVWEYKSLYAALSVFTAVKDKGQIIGTQGMIPIYVNIGGKRYLTGKSENSLLSQSHRGGDLFRQLYDYAMGICRARGMYCIWGFTTAAKVWRDKLGFSVCENIVRTYGLILVSGSMRGMSLPGRVLVSGAALDLLAKAAYLYSFVPRSLSGFRGLSGRDAGKYVLETSIKNISDMNRLYERLKRKYTELIYIEQDEDYVAWRIAKNPHTAYRTYFLYEGDLLRAYCYLNVKRTGFATLTDFTCEESRAGGVLLDYIVGSLPNEKVGLLLFMGNSANPLTADTLHLLGKVGFLELPPFRQHFVLKNVLCNEPSLHDVRNWYVNGLWTEGYMW